MNMSKQHTHTQEAVAEVRTVADSKSEYSELCLPSTTNLLGNMLGGHVMHDCDGIR